VRFAEGETVSTSGAVTARDWDGAVGGIVAIIGTDSVKLNHSIDVSYRGFRGGAVPDENYTGGCRYGLSSSVKDTLYFLPSELNRSGTRAKGHYRHMALYQGTGFALNGGGRERLYSGGGGAVTIMLRVTEAGNHLHAACVCCLGGWEDMAAGHI
jgi:hypothetical protein